MAKQFAALVFCAAFFGSGTLAGSAHASESDEVEAHLWDTLHRYESRALHNYRSHLFVGDDVAALGAALWSLSRTPEFQKRRETCAAAAETLSYMAEGYYRSAIRLQVSGDWHYFSGRYVQQRNACLAALQLDASAYPLPSWFDR